MPRLLEMTNGSKDFNKKNMKRLQHTPQVSQTFRRKFLVAFDGFFTAVSRVFHGLFTVQILWEISGRYFHQIIFCFVFGDIMISDADVCAEPVLPGTFYLHRIEPNGLFIHISTDHYLPT